MRELPVEMVFEEVWEKDSNGLKPKIAIGDRHSIIYVEDSWIVISETFYDSRVSNRLIKAFLTHKDACKYLRSQGMDVYESEEEEMKKAYESYCERCVDSFL